MGVYVNTLTAALRARGHHVTRAVCGGAVGPASPASQASAAELHLAGPLEWESERPLLALQAAVQAGRAQLAACARRGTAAATPPGPGPGPIDILHCNQFAWAGALAGVPSLVAVHSDVLSWWRAVHGRLPPDAGYRSWYQQLGRQALQQAAAVVTPTAAALDDLRQSFSWEGAATVIPNGTDLGPVPAAAAWKRHEQSGRPLPPIEARPQATSGSDPAKSGEPPAVPRRGAVCVGRLGDAAKQVRLLLRPDLPVALTLAGTPPPAPGNARVHYVGPLGRRELAALFGRSRIYVAPSCYEPFGLAPLEAARAGCCLLLNDIASFRETWGEAAYYFARNDGEDLRRWLQLLDRDVALCAAGAARAQRRAQVLSAERMAAAYEALYAHLHEDRAAASGAWQ